MLAFPTPAPFEPPVRNAREIKGLRYTAWLLGRGRRRCERTAASSTLPSLALRLRSERQRAKLISRSILTLRLLFLIQFLGDGLQDQHPIVAGDFIGLTLDRRGRHEFDLRLVYLVAQECPSLFICF
jgi:hypothetical protein